MDPIRGTYPNLTSMYVKGVYSIDRGRKLNKEFAIVDTFYRFFIMSEIITDV